MADPQNPNAGTPQNLPPPHPSKIPSEIRNGGANTNAKADFSGQKVHYPNSPDTANPDPATLREQWRFAIRQYSRWYSHAWGTAILAGLSFFALGWIIKGSNPLPSITKDDSSSAPSSPNDANEARR
ncbi:hypothetical protein P3X46_033211 [Hevea brasiliensis]|uniref:Uncharacterized protein n=1 Tax=Hevea brasiliensis TaxID=3981 RepID=A0ABQ9KIX0_HEVBR|nr:uncharacterized protein LOC110633265 [Hevea brasiliensis]KAJ9136099.1 hypothetical protein P3X46_033211 [Hevea brasiliensis]